MVLTDKAKVDFHQWMDREKRDLRKSYLDDTCYNALKIEWLDSVGIISAVEPFYYDGWLFEALVYDSSGNKQVTEDLYGTRREAVKAAIQKATEIYNKQ